MTIKFCKNNQIQARLRLTTGLTLSISNDEGEELTSAIGPLVPKYFVGPYFLKILFSASLIDVIFIATDTAGAKLRDIKYM